MVAQDSGTSTQCGSLLSTAKVIGLLLPRSLLQYYHMARLGVLLFYVILCSVWASEDRHECDRLCGENEPPKKCYYHFTIQISQRKQEPHQRANRRDVLTINGKSPGPLISVCENDIVVVDVKNQLPSGLETAIQWCGFLEGNSPFMAGVPMITQCPIIPHTTFRYRLKAYKSGSFFYRAHSVAQQLDGVHGPLIVHKATEQIYSEKIIFLSPQMKSLQVLESGFEQDLNVTALHVEVYDVFDRDLENEPKKLRIINAAALDCPVTLFTHIVPLKVVAADGNDVKPVSLNEVILNPGERIDLLVKPEVMKMTHIVGHNLCKGHAKYGFDPGISYKNDETVKANKVDFVETASKLESEKSENLKKGDIRVLLPFDSTVYTHFKGAVDFRYKLGGFGPYVPSILSKSSVSMLQFQNKSFLYPSSPLLSQPKALQEDLVCHSNGLSERCKMYDNGFCECLQIIDLPYNYNVDLFLIDEGKSGNTSQTIHIHGHSFFVLSMKSFDKAISTEMLWEKEVLGEIKRNLVNPVKKDTIIVPNKGFVILRLRPTNPGKWLLESTTSKAKTGTGLEIILNVQNPKKDQMPPEEFPTCGNMKEPDLVFTDD